MARLSLMTRPSSSFNMFMGQPLLTERETKERTHKSGNSAKGVDGKILGAAVPFYAVWIEKVDVDGLILNAFLVQHQLNEIGERGGDVGVKFENHWWYVDAGSFLENILAFIPSRPCEDPLWKGRVCVDMNL